MKKAAFLATTVALASCTAGPDYVSPTIDLPTRFFRAADGELFNAANELWWLKFNDPLLAHYVDRGNAKSLSVKAALERILAAQAAIGRTGANALASGDLSLAATNSGNFEGIVQSRDSATFGAQYVLDLFGGQRRAREEALAEFDAAQYEAGVVRMALISEITDAYIRARYFQAAVQITRGTISSRRQVLGLVQQLRDAGAATLLDVERSRSLLQSAQANLPGLESGFETNVIRLASLIEEPTKHVLAEMTRGYRQPRPLNFTGAGIPANLLRNRPDVRAAERRYAAAVAAIGVAEAQLYPSITLGGSVGITETGAGSVGNWSFGPALTLPIFNRGAIDAARRVASSQAREADIAWRETVRDAVEEVEVALSQAFHLSRQVASFEAALVSSRRVLELSRAGYRAREATLTELLDAEISVSGDQLSLAGAYRDLALAWAQLQVAAGKGWSAPSVQTNLEERDPLILRDPLAFSRPYPLSTVQN